MPPASTHTLPGDAGTATHLIIPFAVCSSDAWLETVTAMPLVNTRHTRALLCGMTRVATDLRSEHSLSTPHERALAQALDLAPPGECDGLLPWAALDAAHSTLESRAGHGWAWVTPCHWAMGREHATLSDPAALGLSEPESRSLLAAMAPYFETDGIRLHFLRADCWLAEGDVFRDLQTASLDRVLGRDVDPWLVKNKTVTRLQNEMQMLLYTHPLNDARSAARRLPVNSFWLSGSGALTQALFDAARKRGRPSPPPSSLVTAARELEAAASRSQQVDTLAGGDLRPLPLAGEGGGESGVEGGGTRASPGSVTHPDTPTLTRALTPRSLADAVFKSDWAGYAQAWSELDAGLVSDLLARQRAGQSVRLTLCGERGFETWQSSPRSWRGQLSNWLASLSVLAPKPILSGRKQL